MEELLQIGGPNFTAELWDPLARRLDDKQEKAGFGSRFQTQLNIPSFFVTMRAVVCVLAFTGATAFTGVQVGAISHLHGGRGGHDRVYERKWLRSP